MSQKQLIWPKDLKKTKHRLAIFEIFESENKPLSIVEIQQALHEKNQQIWLSTIYRILDSFEQSNMINKITMLNQEAVYYELNYNQHAHYAICIKCRNVIELDHCPMNLFEASLERNNFKVYGHRMEIFGVCESCQ